jgi:hypothetical protein
MKMFFKIYPASFRGKSCLVLGVAISCGRAISVRDTAYPTVSGLRIGIGLIFWQIHFLAGTETKWDWPIVPYGELARLNPGILQ